METRLSLLRQMFYGGLLVMLGAGILSATVEPVAGATLAIIAVSGALVALPARLCYWRLLRTAHRREHTLISSARQANSFDGPGITSSDGTFA